MLSPATFIERFRRSSCPCSLPSLSTLFWMMTLRLSWDLNSTNHRKYLKEKQLMTCVSTSQKKSIMDSGNLMAKMHMEVNMPMIKTNGNQFLDHLQKKFANLTKTEWIILFNWVLPKRIWSFKLISTFAHLWELQWHLILTRQLRFWLRRSSISMRDVTKNFWWSIFQLISTTQELNDSTHSLSVTTKKPHKS